MIDILIGGFSNYVSAFFLLRARESCQKVIEPVNITERTSTLPNTMDIMNLQNLEGHINYIHQIWAVI